VKLQYLRHENSLAENSPHNLYFAFQYQDKLIVCHNTHLSRSGLFLRCEETLNIVDSDGVIIVSKLNLK
jgi:hypothetical protein